MHLPHSEELLDRGYQNKHAPDSCWKTVCLVMRMHEGDCVLLQYLCRWWSSLQLKALTVPAVQTAAAEAAAGAH